MGDIFYNVTDWLRGTFLLDAAFWIEETGLSALLVENFWGVPLAQVMHILSIGCAFGATLMLTLRINGMAAQGLTVARVGDRYIPWIWWSLLAIVVSGILMLWAEPVRNMVNSVFWFKMCVLIVLLLVSLAFQKGVRAKAAATGEGWIASAGTRTTSWVILILWCVVMAGGRWIAYAPV